MDSEPLPLPVLLASLSGAAAEPRTLGTLAVCSRPLWHLLQKSDHLLWRLALQHATQQAFVPSAAVQSVASWREMLRWRIQPRNHVCARVLVEDDLHQGDWIDWTALVSVVGTDAAVSKALIDRLVSYDKIAARRQASYLRPFLTRSCVVEAFGLRGRLVFAEFDSGGLDLPHRPRGGLENSDAVVIVGEPAGGIEGAASTAHLLRRADAVIAENMPSERRSLSCSEGSLPRILAFSREAIAEDESDADTRSLVEALQLINIVEEADCDVVTMSTRDERRTNYLLQLLVWSLMGQSPARAQRLKDTGGHKLLDSRVFWQGRDCRAPCQKRRSRSLS